MIPTNDTPTISENFSEIKRKVGRPKKSNLPSDAKMENLYVDYAGLSDRSKLNKKYYHRAVGVLGFHTGAQNFYTNPRAEYTGEYGHLFPYKNGALKQGKQTTLSELGKIKHDELLKKIAKEICELKLSAKESKNFIKLILAGEGE